MVESRAEGRNEVDDLATKLGIRILRGASLALALLLATAPAFADERPTVAERLLDILREKELIDDAQYDELLAQAKAERDERAAPAPAKPDPEWKVGWSNGFYFNRSDDSMRLRIGGLVQNDGAVINESRRFDEEIGGVGTGTEFRRARIWFEGGLYEHLIFRTEYDFAEGDPSFKDVWVGFQALPVIGRVRVGHMKEPFSLEQVTSDRFTTFMERALPDAFAPGRNTGILAERNFFGERMYVGAGGFANTDDKGFEFSNGANYNATVRVAGLPIFSEDGARVLHLGLNYSHQFRDAASLRYRQRPEAHLAPYVVDTGAIPGVSGADLVGGEIAAVFGPMSLQSEVMASFLDRQPGLENPSFWGTYVQGSYFLTGETRDYNAESAAFSRTAPKHPFSISKGTWGAFEVALRYSHLDLDGEDVRGGIANDVTGALNWYPYANMRVVLNYVYSHLAGVGDANIVQSRVQVDF